MSFDATQKILSELESGENLLWSGQPLQGIRLKSSDVFMIPFSLLWGGFAIFWELSVILSGGPVSFIIFGLPFVLVGLYMIFGRFYMEAKLRKKTFYGLTRERIIIVSGLYRKKVNSLDLRTLTDISFSESSGGKGSISFGNSSHFGLMFGGFQWPGMEHLLGPRFELIQNVKAVYQQIREAQKKAACQNTLSS